MGQAYPLEGVESVGPDKTKQVGPLGLSKLGTMEDKLLVAGSFLIS